MTLMAATSGLDIEYIRGRTGDEVSDRTLPPPAARNSLRPGDIGSWRAHLDAISAYDYHLLPLRGDFFRPAFRMERLTRRMSMTSGS